MADVIEIKPGARERAAESTVVDPGDVLRAALNANPARVVVVGRDADGDYMVFSSHGTDAAIADMARAIDMVARATVKEE